MEPTLFIIGILAGGFVFGNLARLIVPGSQRLTWSETILVGIAGAGLGGLAANFTATDTAATAFRWGTIIGSLAGSVLVLLIVEFVVNRLGIRRERPPMPIADLLAAGEGSVVEFKQTARWNVHTKQRDAKIELVIAKTVAGFLNAEGGTLLIGVDDNAQPVGLTEDLSLMKEPDLDRYELCLTDLLERCLGKPAMANAKVSFAHIEGAALCRVDVARSPAPVFLDEPGGNREADMYVRMGNSTRKLLTDEAVEYVAHHW